MVVAYRTFQSVAITGLVDEELVPILPKSLRFIAHNGMILFFYTVIEGGSWESLTVGKTGMGSSKLMRNRSWV